MLCWGPLRGAVVVVSMPLFEEANRTRAFVAAICRALAVRNIASAVPDLPGQGESLVPLEQVSFARMELAYAAAVDRFDFKDRHVFGLAIRSGALVDRQRQLYGRWQLSPQAGPDLLRELSRVMKAGDGDLTQLLAINDEPAGLPRPPLEVAGNLVSPGLLTDLAGQHPWTEVENGTPVRVVRLTGDPRPADLHVDGTPLWRRSEPGNDPALANALAADIVAWMARCGG